MDHQALAAVDIPIFAEPDQFVAQMLDELDAKKTAKVKPRPEMKNLVHWNDAPTGKSSPSRGQPMTLWDMAMTLREFAKEKACDLRPSAARLARRSLLNSTGRCRLWGTMAAAPSVPDPGTPSAPHWRSRIAIG